MLRHYGFQDPPPWIEKVVPLGFVMLAIAQSKPYAFDQCVADLLVIALFFCLRSCEYTKTNSHRRKTQFRFQDVQFHDANGVMPPDAAVNLFLEASAITLFLDTQENSVLRESYTMESTGLLHGYPVQSCSQRYIHLWKNNAPPDTPICAYYVFIGVDTKSVTGENIAELLRATAKQIGFQRLGFFPYNIGSHSLRSGDAMALHQAHISYSTIKIIGRWISDAFLIYFQGHVATFTKKSLQVNDGGAMVHTPGANPQCSLILHPFITVLIQPKSVTSWNQPHSPQPPPLRTHIYISSHSNCVSPSYFPL